MERSNQYYILHFEKMENQSTTKKKNELWKGRPSIVKYFRDFGSKCYIKGYDEDLEKFESRVDEGIFLGYSSRSKDYRCYNKT